MKQQLSLIEQSAIASTSLAASSSINPLKYQPESVATLIASSSKPTIDSILTVPSPFERSGKRRNYKKKNHGGMTSNDIMDQYQKDEEEKTKAEIENKSEK